MRQEAIQGMSAVSHTAGEQSKGGQESDPAFMAGFIGRYVARSCRKNWGSMNKKMNLCPLDASAHLHKVTLMLFLVMANSGQDVSVRSVE